MGVHIDWLLIQEVRAGEITHRSRIGVVRFGNDFREWLDPYSAVCSVVVVGSRAYFTAAVHEDGRDAFLRTLLSARHALREILQPLGVTVAEWERMKGGQLLPRRFRV
jgi:hypothetical protein